MTKINNDAIESMKGIIYQLYFSVQYCHELNEGQSIYFEKFGDITVSKNKQIEIKKYKENLTDSHENLWKTLKNWLAESFTHTYYKNLILLTTQEIKKNSSLFGWNEKSSKEKHETLKNIYLQNSKKYIAIEKSKWPSSLNFMEAVITHEKKLLEILDKFSILDSSPVIEEQYSNLVTKCTNGVLTAKKELYIQNLIGFILSPRVLNGSGNNWTLTYDEIEKQRQLLISEFCRDTHIFPKKHYKNREGIYSEEHDEKLYIKKILKIKYSEIVPIAKRDYISACNTIIDDFQHGLLRERFDRYESSIVEKFITSHRKSKRKITSDHNYSECQDFYDEISNEESIIIDGFNDTPREFKNGIIHINMDDDEQTLSWDLL
ncbi:Uncharacterised protein [Cedecea lapagei]|uniref:Uncharacterized protein n=1 Tax=Cedecea lapagei TaxID=158823 RepID=A0A3S4IBA6_9ENTR|nr:hypothetical protein [Cedecea lapagei]VEB94949.1 Uncharacterised protein [Cedecea lapagei]